MNRRHFLRNLMALSGSGLLPSYAGGQTHRSDVIVIGAGMAGLTAARRLAQAGLRVQLLEGSSRVGGRMLSVPGPAEHGIELGAQYVHGSRAPTHELLRQLGVKTRPVPSAGRRYLDTDGVLRPLESAAADALYEQFLTTAQAYRGADISVQALLDTMALNARQQRWLAADPLSYAAEPDQLSLFALLDYSPAWDALTDTNYQVVGGYGRVAQQLAGDLGSAVRLNTRVAGIGYRRGRVQVHAITPGGPARFKAAAAVVTLPLGVLQAGHVTFDPGLPPWKIAALQQLAMGRVVVQQMTFAADFWSEQLGAAGAWSMNEGRVSISAVHSAGEGPPALRAWVTGRATDSLASLDPAQTQARILDWIALGFPGRDVAGLKRWAAHKDWQRDPFTLGAYSYTRPGGRYAREQLATPLRGALFFAGEATAGSPDYQTVHGAYLTGLRAAREVIAAL